MAFVHLELSYFSVIELICLNRFDLRNLIKNIYLNASRGISIVIFRERNMTCYFK